MLTVENAEEYIKLVKEFCLYTGIRRQLDAFKGNEYYVALNAGCNATFLSILTVRFVYGYKVEYLFDFVNSNQFCS